jgi:acyl-coenzyme A thioesterase PaaI-like protein
MDIEAINAMVRDGFPGSRNRCVEIGPDFVVAEHDVQEAEIRPGGFVSGPTQFAVADSAMWFATFVALDRIEPMALPSELSIRFLRPAQGSVLRCRAAIEAVSRRSVVMTAHVWCDDRPDRVTAIAQGSYAIPMPR